MEVPLVSPLLKGSAKTSPALESPVRRPEPRHYAPLFEEDDGSLWTARRCQRLLRPLISQVSNIRKNHKRFNVGGRIPSNGVSRAPVALSSARVADTGAARCTSDHNTDDDPDWAPGRAAKRARHTYSTKGQSLGRQERRSVRNTARNRVDITGARLPSSTPRVSVPKAFAALDASPRHTWNTGDQEESPLLSRRAGRRKSISASHAEILICNEHVYERIMDSLSTLLTATRTISEESQRARKGARPLFASCLAQVPLYLKHLEASLEAEGNEETEHICSYLYEYLESLSQNSNGSWRPLREIVRAHGIAIIIDAISEDIVPLPRALEWALLAAEKGCFQEGDCIIQAVIQNKTEREHLKLGSEDLDSDDLIHFLMRYGAQYKRTHLLWQHLCDTLSSGRQTIGWFMNPRRRQLWNCMIRQYVHRGGSHRTLEKIDELLCLFFEKAIRPGSSTTEHMIHSLRLQSHRMKKLRLSRPMELESGIERTPNLEQMPWMFVSLMEVFASLLILHPFHDNQQAAAAMRNIVKHVELVQVTAHQIKTTEFQKCISLLPLFTIALVESFEGLVRGQLPDTGPWPQTLAIKKQTSDVLVRLVFSITKSCSDLSKSEPRTFLDKMSRHLLKISDDGGPQAFASVAVDAAFDFSDYQPKSANLDLALELQEEAEAMTVDAASPPRASMPTRKTSDRPAYRWEDSISEWVTKTPSRHRSAEDDAALNVWEVASVRPCNNLEVRIPLSMNADAKRRREGRYRTLIRLAEEKNKRERSPPSPRINVELDLNPARIRANYGERHPQYRYPGAKSTKRRYLNEQARSTRQIQTSRSSLALSTESIRQASSSLRHSTIVPPFSGALVKPLKERRKSVHSPAAERWFRSLHRRSSMGSKKGVLRGSTRRQDITKGVRGGDPFSDDELGM